MTAPDSPPASAPKKTDPQPQGLHAAPGDTPARGTHLRLRAVEAENDGLSSPLNPRFNFSVFVVGKPNEFAHAAARRVATS